MVSSLRFVTCAWVLISCTLLTRAGFAGELENLIEEYNAAKKTAGRGGGGGPGGGGGGGKAGGWGGGKQGGRWGRGGGGDESLKLILLKIASLRSPEALAFIQGEFLKERPAVAASCVEPLLSFPGDKVLDFLFANFAKRDRTVKQEILVKLAESERNLAPLEGKLIGILRSEQQAEVRRELPRLLGKIDTVSAAKALLASLRAGPRAGEPASAPPPPPPPQGGGGPGGPGGGGGGPPWGGRGRGGWGGERPETFERLVVNALKATKNDEVKAWLADDAYSGAPPARLEALAEVAGELKLEAARPQLERHLDSTEDAVALKCLEAILKIGPGPSEARITEVVKKGKHGLAFRVQALDTLAAVGTPEALAALKAAAKDQNPETRAVALGSLARVPVANEEAFQVLLAGLKDAEATVRGAALLALQRIRHKQMVPTLIDFLESEKDERLKVNALQLLVQITQKNMGLVVEDWRKWWELTEPKFEFAQVEEKVAVTTSQAHDLKYFGVEINSKRIAFLLDASYSMQEEMDVYITPKKPEDGKTRVGPGGAAGGGAAGGGGNGTGGAGSGQGPDGAAGEKKSGPRTRARKLDVMKREMTRLLNELPKDTLLNLITFAENPKPWQETLQPLTGGGREKVVSFVQGITMGFGTNVFDTLELALKDKRVDTIFLLTDGLPRNGKHVDPPSILREVQVLNRVRGVVINCIAFGEQSELLKELANQNGGTYRFVDSY